MNEARFGGLFMYCVRVSVSRFGTVATMHAHTGKNAPSVVITRLTR